MGLSRWKGAGLAAVLLLGSVWGCGGADRPVKVGGVVILDGEPVADAVVAFQPVADKGQPATGLTDQHGAFRLATQTDDGAFPGEYKVVVVKQEQTFQKGASSRRSLFPAIYGSASTTPLSCTVPPPGPVKLELQNTPGARTSEK